MNATAIRDVLRNGDAQDLDTRRKIVFLSTLALAEFGLIALYQTGVNKMTTRLPFTHF